MGFNVGDEVEFRTAVVQAALDDDMSTGGRGGYAGGVLRRAVEQGFNGGVLVATDYGYGGEAPYEIETGGGKVWAEEEWLKTPDMFQPGEYVNWVYSDGSIRADGYWSNSKVLEQDDWLGAFEDDPEFYRVERADGTTGLIRGAQLRVVSPASPFGIARPAFTFDKVKENSKILIGPAGVNIIDDADKFTDISEYTTSFEFTVLDDEDAVSEPSHYKAGMPEGIEVRDIIKAQGFWEAFCAGNVIKYSLRWQYKNGIEDLKKMVQYAQWLIEEREEQGNG